MISVFNKLLQEIACFCCKNRVSLGAGLAALLIVEGMLIWFELDAIEQDIGNRVSQTMEIYGFKRVTVHTAGRDVRLSGAVSSASGETTFHAGSGTG